MKAQKIIQADGGIEAHLVAARCFWNNAPDTFRATVTYRQYGKYQFSDHGNIDRLNKADAIYDAEIMAKDYLNMNQAVQS